ncbi:MAG: 6-phosphofructokinase [Deltaproteobacteria bacterium]|nr:6-phosphofructokinase [Deltaproteobacteria bacterium]
MSALLPGDRLALLTSGGDAPGMNAALRAAAKVGGAMGFDVVGVEDGYVGLMEGRVRSLDLRTLDEASRRGGTLLGSARSKVFPTAEGQARAREVIVRENLAGLVVIGGNGSLAGARSLRDAPTARGTLRVAGIPASIDNDLACTTMAIGVDTAMNTIVEACDRIADTASAHRRTFVVEVMGRDCGYLAMTSGVAAGADAVLVPEIGKSEEAVIEQVVGIMVNAYQRFNAKRRVLVIKAEGVKIDSNALKEGIERAVATQLPDVDTRVTVLGHVVRGGTPSAFDRLLAARLAHGAVRALADGLHDVMAGWIGPGAMPNAHTTLSAHDPYIVLTPLDAVLRETQRLMNGESEVAQWRRRIFSEIEPILAR